jgi:succinyl-diaminopimelate desuccinylase
MPSAAVALAQELIRFPTIAPPGDEQRIVDHLAGLLGAAGFVIETVDLAPGRPNLVATIGGTAAKPPLAFTGHVDVVPLGARDWSVPPFDGLIRDGRLHGRGASDMKAGVAAFVIAAIEMAPKLVGTPGIALLITAGEETGSEGAAALARSGRLPAAGALVVAEPTSNRPLLGHKGALWLTATVAGVTAHGSMPEKGVNAVLKAARMAAALESFDFNVKRHDLMGAPTLNVGFLRGGINVNSVPDRAEIGIDCRTIPGMRHDRLKEELQSLLGEEAAISVEVDLESVYTPANDPWMAAVHAACETIQGARPAIETAPYFTDASVFTPALAGVSTVILGPGEAAQAHQTDEWCEVARIDEAVALYARLIADWCLAER